jgi:hypothetical protein
MVPAEPSTSHMHFGNMRDVWRTLDARVRQYYSFLANNVPQELLQVLRRRLVDPELPNDAPKLDRMRPGGTPRVRMPPAPER